MKTLIIAVLCGEYLKVAEELENTINESEKGKDDGFVSIHSFDMLNEAYQEKFAECEKLKVQNQKLNIELSKYRYFIECQKNEIEKL